MIKLILLTNLITLVFGNRLPGDWVSFKARHGKDYSSPEEELRRMQVYQQNNELIQEHNRLHGLGLIPFSMKMNQFGDMTDAEFESMFLWPMGNDTNRPDTSGLSRLQEEEEEDEQVGLPQEMDWRILGGLSPVKTQGPCGSCWAFSATGAIEAQVYLKTRRRIELSEQNLLDCSSFNKYGNSGCTGGLMTFAYTYILENGGVDTEASYPYEGRFNQCRFRKNSIGATIKGYKTIDSGNEYQLKKAVATIGPISVGLEASDSSFRFYHEGIFYKWGCGRSGVNHAALVVGYGTEAGEDYWLVKNSWGTAWGEKGYFKMARNKDDQCGIASLASYPVL